MRRVLCALVSAYISGVLAAHVFSAENLLLLFFVLLFAVIIKFSSGKSTPLWLFALVLFFTGGIMNYTARNYKLELRANFLSENSLTYTAEIIENPKEYDTYTKLSVRVLNITFPETTNCYEFPAKIVLYINDGENALAFGDKISFTCTLSEFKKAMNEGSFSSELYHKTQGFCGKAYINSGGITVLERNTVKGFLKLTETLQGFIKTNLAKYLKGDYLALAEGFVLGDTSSLSDSLYKNVERCGLLHLFAVSGFNVSVVLMVISFILGRFIKSRKIVSCVSMIFIFLLCALAGFSVSVMRSGLMAAIYLIALFVNRDNDTLTSLFTAAFIVLIINPFYLFDAGFLLSYLATLGLILFATPINNIISRGPKALTSALSVTIAAQIFTTPVTVLFFGELSLVSLVTNTLLVPFSSFILCAILIMLMTGYLGAFMGSLLGRLITLALKPFIFVINFFGELPFAVTDIAFSDIFVIIFYGVFVFSMYILFNKLSKKRLNIATALILVVVLFSVVYNTATADLMQVMFVNVGQGDCSIVKLPGSKAIMIDGGGVYGGSDNIGERIVLPFMKKHGIKKIDIAILSHFHDDHAEGIINLAGLGYIKKLIIPERNNQSEIYKSLVVAANKTNTEIIEITDETEILVGENISFKIFKPLKKDENENNNSLLIRLLYKNTSFLYTGDLESDALLAYKKAENIDSDVLKVPHHGGKDAVNKEAIYEISPEYAVISVGKNSYGHPSKNTLEGYKNVNAKILRTDQNGSIVFYTDGNEINKVKILYAGDNYGF